MKKKHERGEIELATWIIIAIIVGGILWYFTGGPERAAQNPSPYLEDPTTDPLF